MKWARVFGSGYIGSNNCFLVCVFFFLQSITAQGLYCFLILLFFSRLLRDMIYACPWRGLKEGGGGRRIHVVSPVFFILFPFLIRFFVLFVSRRQFLPVCGLLFHSRQPSLFLSLWCDILLSLAIFKRRYTVSLLSSFPCFFFSPSLGFSQPITARSFTQAFFKSYFPYACDTILSRDSKKINCTFFIFPSLLSLSPPFFYTSSRCIAVVRCTQWRGSCYAAMILLCSVNEISLHSFVPT